MIALVPTLVDICLFVIEEPKLLNEASVVDFAALVICVSSDELVKEIPILLLEVLRDPGATVDHLHEVLELNAVVAVKVCSEAVLGDVVQILLKEKLPLVHGTELFLGFNLFFDLIEDGDIVGSLDGLDLGQVES